MPRVMYVHHRPQASGAVRSLALLIEALDPRWEVHVLVPCGDAARVLAAAGATVHLGAVPSFTHTWDVQYGGLRWLVFAREAASIPSHLQRLDRLLRLLNPAIVHLNDVVLLPSGWLSHRTRSSVVWHLRSSLPHGGRDRRSRWIADRLDAWSDAVIAIDEDVARTYPLRTPINVIPNAVVVEAGDAARLAVPDGRVTIGYFGYLRRQKGWPQLVEATRLLVDAGAPVHVVVIGGGVRRPEAFGGVRGRLLPHIGIRDEEGDLRARVRELGLDDRFTFLPFTTSPGRIYRALDIVVFPNQGTGLGRPVLEAAAYGKPVVAAGSVDGAGIVVNGETGTLLAEATPAALAEALSRLVREPELRARYGAAAIAIAQRRDAKTIAAHVEDLYESLTRRR